MSTNTQAADSNNVALPEENGNGKTLRAIRPVTDDSIQRAVVAVRRKQEELEAKARACFDEACTAFTSISAIETAVTENKAILKEKCEDNQTFEQRLTELRDAVDERLKSKILHVAEATRLASLISWISRVESAPAFKTRVHEEMSLGTLQIDAETLNPVLVKEKFSTVPRDLMDLVSDALAKKVAEFPELQWEAVRKIVKPTPQVIIQEAKKKSSREDLRNRATISAVELAHGREGLATLEVVGKNPNDEPTTLLVESNGDVLWPLEAAGGDSEGGLWAVINLAKVHPIELSAESLEIDSQGAVIEQHPPKIEMPDDLYGNDADAWRKKADFFWYTTATGIEAETGCELEERADFNRRATPDFAEAFYNGGIGLYCVNLGGMTNREKPLNGAVLVEQKLVGEKPVIALLDQTRSARKHLGNIPTGRDFFSEGKDWEGLPANLRFVLLADRKRVIGR